MADPKRQLVEIACDESGNTGENLTGTQQGVFSEGSHDLDLDESLALLDWIRSQAGTGSRETKWKDIRSDEDLVLELFGDRLRGRANFYLTEKTYFIVGKVVDLLLEELAHDHGHDMYVNGEARKRAFTLYRNGRRALGSTPWEDLLSSFNSLMRRDSQTQKLKAVSKTTVHEFFEHLEVSRWQSKRRDVGAILSELTQTKKIADQFVSSLDPTSHPIPALDPLVPSLAQTIRHWYEHNGRLQIAVLHDEGPVPSSTAMTALVAGLRDPGEFRRFAPPVNIKSVRTADSKTDARLQIADFVAGFGARSGQQALSGTLEEPMLNVVRSTIFSTSLWGDEDSANLLGLDV